MAEDRVGKYNIVEEIASGSQGAVYRAFDSDTGRIVAVKVLHPEVARDPSFVERFRREARIAASIDHPNVVKLYDVGESDGRLFIALEFLPESLARVVKSGGQIPIARAAGLAAQIADGLAAAGRFLRGQRWPRAGAGGRGDQRAGLFRLIKRAVKRDSRAWYGLTF